MLKFKPTNRLFRTRMHFSAGTHNHFKPLVLNKNLNNNSIIIIRIKKNNILGRIFDLFNKEVKELHACDESLLRFGPLL